jgi:hypothetical protein
MRRALILILILAALGAGAWLVVEYVPFGPQLVPLTSSGRGQAALPANTVVLHVKAGKNTVEPFNVDDDPSAVDGLALRLPEGKASSKRTGQLSLPFVAPAAGRYFAWARVQWRDECGNSLGFQIDALPKRTLVDGVFGSWHWVPAGEYELTTDEHTLMLTEREDGIALDQILFTPDAAFRPEGAILSGKMQADVRRFADAFDRSPGHGIGPWNLRSGKWDIEFSFDPNRVPNQYALTGSAKGEGVALIKTDPWRGCQLAFSMRATQAPKPGGLCGAVVDVSKDGSRKTVVGIDFTPGKERLVVTGAGKELSADLRGRVRLGDWHRVVIERWAWTLQVSVDGREVLGTDDLEPTAGRFGLFIKDASAAFDDVAAEEIPWLADDGKQFTIPWTLGPDAEWFRPGDTGIDAALIGRAGVIRPPDIGLPLIEIQPPRMRALVVPRPFFRTAPGTGAPQHGIGFGVEIKDSDPPALVHRVALRYGASRPRRDVFRIGPYHFTEPRIVDPGDYYEFTPEEVEAMRNSSEAEKLRRRKKYVPLVGRGAHCVWSAQSGRWMVKQGELVGPRRGGELHLTQEVISDLELVMKVKLDSPSSSVDVALYGTEDSGIVTRIAGIDDVKNGLRLAADGKWHTLRMRVDGDVLTAQLDKDNPVSKAIERGDGGSIRLITTGPARFDDVELRIPRAHENGVFCAFDRRETGWWRDGEKWVDHGGMACAFTSHWISLIAPEKEGMLWHKRSFSSDVQVGFNLEENSTWYGWDQRPDHEHHAYDNIRACLSKGRDANSGYRLELNTGGETIRQTVLYRNGVAVKTVLQDPTFPMRYVGGHTHYAPRKNRVSLVKRGGLIRALVNGQEVLRYDDPAPLPVDTVGVGGYKTRVNFSHVEIRDLSEK